MLDISVSYNRYKFLGHEFLTWLWFAIENEPDKLQLADADMSSLDLGNRIVLENHFGDLSEVITIKGDDAGLEEGRLALKKGAMVTEMNLSYKSGEYEWRFSLKGESLNVSNLKTPDTGKAESKDDLEGAVLEKMYLYEKAVGLTDRLFQLFIRLRISEDWGKMIISSMREWINSHSE